MNYYLIINYLGSVGFKRTQGGFFHHVPIKIEYATVRAAKYFVSRRSEAYTFMRTAHVQCFVGLLFFNQQYIVL